MYKTIDEPFYGYTKERYNKIVDKLINYTLEIDTLALKNEQDIQWYTPLKCIFSRQREKIFVYLPAKFLQQEGYLSTSIDLSNADKYIIPWEKFNVDGKTIEDFFSSLPNMVTPPKYEEMFQYVRCLYNKPGAKIPTDDYGNKKSSQVDNFRKAFKSILNELKKFQSKDDDNKIKNEYFYGVLLILIIKRVLSLVDKGYDINYGSDYLPKPVRVSNLDTKKDNCSITQLDGTKSSLNSHYVEKEYAMFLINLSDIINLRMILECIVNLHDCISKPNTEYLPTDYFSEDNVYKRFRYFYTNNCLNAPFTKSYYQLVAPRFLVFHPFDVMLNFISYETAHILKYEVDNAKEKFFSTILDFRTLLSIVDTYIFKIYVDNLLENKAKFLFLNNIYPEKEKTLTYSEKLADYVPINKKILTDLLSIKKITLNVTIRNFEDFSLILSNKDTRFNKKTKKFILDTLFFNLNKTHKNRIIKNNKQIAETIVSFLNIDKKNSKLKNFYYFFITMYLAIRFQNISVNFFRYPLKDYIQKIPKLSHLILKEYQNDTVLKSNTGLKNNMIFYNSFNFTLYLLSYRYCYLFTLNENIVKRPYMYESPVWVKFNDAICHYEYDSHNIYYKSVLDDIFRITIAN